MKRKIISIIILFTMVFTLFTPRNTVSISADKISVDDVSKSIEEVKDSIKQLDGVIEMSDDIKKALIDDFTGFTDFFKTIGSIVGPINGTVTFLRLIGIMRDPVTDALTRIQTQLNDISEKLTNMDKKLDEIATQMSRLEATEEFHFRATQAQLFRQNWNNFRNLYMEKGLDNLMLQYNSMVMDAWKNWFEAADNSDPNLRSILVWFDNDKGVSKVQNTLMNGFDEKHNRSDEYNDPYTLYADEFDTSNDRLISFNEDFFEGAKTIIFNINTYHDELKNYIKTKIAAELKEETDNMRRWDMPDGIFTDAYLNEIANNTIDMITFKLSNKVINSSSEFSNNVLNQYNLYCDHLSASSEGIDALIRSMYFTHAFEFEIKEDLLNLINSLNLQTGVYSTFVANVICNSVSIRDEDKERFTSKMCETIDGLAKLKKSAITGEDRYSYITNTVIDYGKLNINTEVAVDGKDIALYKYYVGCRGGSMNASTIDSSNNKHDTSAIIGDASALLLSYMVRSNGETFNHDYMNDHLTVNKQNDNGGLVSSYNGEQDMTRDSNIRLASHNIIGSYFENDPEVYLNSLPGDAEFGYVNLHKMATGTLFNSAASSLDVNRSLIGAAVYGETHKGWFKDESALMYGPTDLGSRGSGIKRDVTYEDTFSTYSVTLYQTIDYNTLLSLKLKDNEAINDETSTINKYLDYVNETIINRDIDHVHNWDGGTIVKQASGNEPGVIEHKCLDEYDNASSYTKLYYNNGYATLTFDLDGGTLETFGNDLSRQFNIGSLILLPTEPTKEGYTFQYWSDKDHPADSEYEVNGDRTFKAIWVLSKEYRLDKKTDIEWNTTDRNAPYIRVYRVENSDATLSHFKGVSVDGATVNKNDYQVENGSLILNFQTGYLKSLKAGSHLVEILFDDGKVEFMLKIKDEPADGRKEYRLPITGIE